MLLFMVVSWYLTVALLTAAFAMWSGEETWDALLLGAIWPITLGFLLLAGAFYFLYVFARTRLNRKPKSRG